MKKLNAYLKGLLAQCRKRSCFTYVCPIHIGVELFAPNVTVREPLNDWAPRRCNRAFSREPLMYETLRHLQRFCEGRLGDPVFGKVVREFHGSKNSIASANVNSRASC